MKPVCARVASHYGGAGYQQQWVLKMKNYSLNAPGEELVRMLQTLCDWCCTHLHMKPSMLRNQKVGSQVECVKQKLRLCTQRLAT
jgi:hypothetical protein